MNKLDPVQCWVDNVAYAHSQSQNTSYKYKRSLNQFAEFIGKSVAEILDDYKQLDEKEFKRTYAQYLKAFISELSCQGYVANSINTVIAAIKSFFKYSDLPIGFVPTGNKRVIYHNRDIVKEEVLAILAASKPRDKAFFCMMAQSGLRPDTLVKLKLKDIEPDFSNGKIPCMIKVAETQTKGAYSSYFSFMGQESVDYLKAYFHSERPNIQPNDYIFSLTGSNTNLARKDKIASTKSFSILFAKTLRQLQESKVLSYEKRANGKPSELRLYTLRKYFRRCAGNAGPDFVNFWMGHLSDLKVDLSYFSKNIESPAKEGGHRAKYAENAMPQLRLESYTPTEREQEIIKKSEEIDSLTIQVANLTRTVDSLKKTIDVQSNYIQRTQSPSTEQDIKLLTLARLIKKTMDTSGLTLEEFVKSISSSSEDGKK